MATRSTATTNRNLLCSSRRELTHPNGQTTAYFCDSFADPWVDNETILIQHGFGRTSTHFYHWVPLLARNYNVIRRDLRGHGGSSYPDPDQAAKYYTTSTILEEIADMLDQLGVARVHFFGESTGGMLAMAFAATYPERVISVALCSTPTHLPVSGQQFLAFGEESWPAACRKLGARQWAERLMAVPGTQANSDPAYLRWWLNEVSVSDGEGLAGYAEFLCGFDARPYLADVRCPMLILAPTNSAMVTREMVEGMAAQIPSADTVFIEAKGHEIYSEAAEACQKAFLRFLSSFHNRLSN